MAEVTAATKSACSGNSRLSSWNGFQLELNLERDKTGDLGKFHDTNIIHILKFMITRDHTLLISNPFSLQRPFGYLLTFSFIFYYSKQGLDTFDEG